MYNEFQEKTKPCLAAVITLFIVPLVVLWMIVCATLLVVLWPILPLLVYLNLLQNRKAD